MQRLSLYFAVTCAIVFALVTGCGSPLPAASPRAESLLLAAGFKTVVASTDAQLKQIPTLPPGQVTVITQTGKNWFVYPDLPRNQVYVGTEKEYQAYLKLADPKKDKAEIDKVNLRLPTLAKDIKKSGK